MSKDLKEVRASHGIPEGRTFQVEGIARAQGGSLFEGQEAYMPEVD